MNIKDKCAELSQQPAKQESLKEDIDKFMSLVEAYNAEDIDFDEIEDFLDNLADKVEEQGLNALVCVRNDYNTEYGDEFDTRYAIAFVDDGKLQLLETSRFSYNNWELGVNVDEIGPDILISAYFEGHGCEATAVSDLEKLNKFINDNGLLKEQNKEINDERGE